jgi:hypothetical protein
MNNIGSAGGTELVNYDSVTVCEEITFPFLLRRTLVIISTIGSLSRDAG